MVITTDKVEWKCNTFKATEGVISLKLANELVVSSRNGNGLIHFLPNQIMQSKANC